MPKAVRMLINSCGHKSQYSIAPVDLGIDITSKINGICPICKREDAEFKAQIVEVFSRMFES